jgi:Secretion system C-terminal sorting domain/FG-GAP-like repeat
MMKIKIISTVVAIFICSTMYSQWINFNDETDQRIVISNVTGNNNQNLVDDQEKDMAVGDFDNDSFMDLVVVRKSPFSNIGPKTDLLFMNRNGVLEDQTDIYAPEFLSNESDSRDVFCVDVNNDDWLDLFVINTFGDQPQLFINQGNDGNGDWIGFVDESSTRLPLVTVNIIQFCAGWGGDLTGNGFADLYMVNYDGSGLALDVLFINDGTGHFTEESQSRMGELRNSSFGTGVEFHDVDNDGDLDIVKNLGLNIVPPFNTKGTIVLFNNGDATFTNFFKLPGAQSYMFTAGDLDEDGMLEFYEVDDQTDYVNSIRGFVVDESLTINQTFLPTTRTDDWGGNVKMIDLDGDGDLDVGMSSVDTDQPPCETNQNRRFIIFENEGDHSGNLLHPYGSDMNDWNLSTYDHDFIDLNNDNFMDIILGTCDGYKIFMQEPILSVENPDFGETIHVYPNPNNGVMNVTIDAVNSTYVTMEVLTINGRLLTTISHDIVLTNVLNVDLDLRHFIKTGMYFLKLTTNNGSVTKKIIIE